MANRSSPGLQPHGPARSSRSKRRTERANSHRKCNGAGRLRIVAAPRARGAFSRTVVQDSNIRAIWAFVKWVSVCHGPYGPCVFRSGHKRPAPHTLRAARTGRAPDPPPTLPPVIHLDRHNISYYGTAMTAVGRGMPRQCCHPERSRMGLAVAVAVHSACTTADLVRPCVFRAAWHHGRRPARGVRRTRPVRIPPPGIATAPTATQGTMQPEPRPAKADHP